MTHWSADDIQWSQFDPARLDPELLKVVKAASMVERNAADYTLYLKNVLGDEPGVAERVGQWQSEEIQHGDVLGRYAQMADPAFDFQRRFKRFTDGYRIPVDATQSVRGSATGELIARCVVEIGTSSMYSALRDAADEPVLKSICHRIAGDEFRHYKMFFDLMQVPLKREGVGLIRRVMVAVSRIAELDDDELAYAWHAANDAWSTPYDRERCSRAYGVRVFPHYRDEHVDRAVNMAAKAVGLDPKGWPVRMARSLAKRRIEAMASAA